MSSLNSLTGLYRNTVPEYDEKVRKWRTPTHFRATPCRFIYVCIKEPRLILFGLAAPRMLAGSIGWVDDRRRWRASGEWPVVAYAEWLTRPWKVPGSDAELARTVTIIAATDPSGFEWHDLRGEPMDLADMVREASKGGVNVFRTLIRRFRVYRRDTSSLGMTGIDLKMSKASSAFLFAEPESNDRRQP